VDTGKKDVQKLQRAEMRLLKSVKSCTGLHKVRNADVRRKIRSVLSEWQN
jgi:hypothetical protein